MQSSDHRVDSGSRAEALAALLEHWKLTSPHIVPLRFRWRRILRAHLVLGASYRSLMVVDVVQRQLGTPPAGTTSTDLQGIDPSEIIDAVRSRRQPRFFATAGFTLYRLAARRRRPAAASRLSFEEPKPQRR